MAVSKKDEYKYLILALKSDQIESCDFDFVILTEPVNRAEISVFILNFEACLKETAVANDQKQLGTKKQAMVEFPDILLKLEGKFILENACLMCESKDLALFYDYRIYLIDIQIGRIIFTKDLAQPSMSAEFFLSPTNLESNRLYKLTAIEITDCLVALSNLS